METRRSFSWLWVAGLAWLGLLMVVLFIGRAEWIYDERYFMRNVLPLGEWGFGPYFLQHIDQGPGPLYQFVHLPLHPLTQGQGPWIRLVNVVGLALLGVMGYRYLRLRPDFRAEQIAWLMAIPMTWVLGGLALSEMPALLAGMGSLLLLHRAQTRSQNLFYLLSGLAWGLCIIGRTQFLLLAPLWLGWALLGEGFAWARSWRWLGAGLWLVGCIPFPAYVFGVWGGLTPPASVLNGVTDGLALSWANLGLAAAYAAFSAAIIRPEWFRVPIYFWIVGLVLGIGLAGADLFHFIPAEGLLTRLLGGSLALWVGRGMLGLMLGAGLVLAASLSREALRLYRQEPLLVLWILAFLIVSAASVKVTIQFSSRYVGQAVPFLVLASAAYPAERSPRWTQLLRFGIGAGLGLLSLLGYLLGQ